MKEITVHELKEKKEKGEKFTLLDVREKFEYQISNLNGTLIPLQQLKDRLDKLDKDKEIVVMCRSGSRSLTACHTLRENGFENVVNLKGGVNAWAREIDSSMPIY